MEAQRRSPGSLERNRIFRCSGLLFEYTFTNTSGATDAIEEMRVTNFAGFTTDVNASGLGETPTSIGRSSGDGDLSKLCFF